MKIFVTGASGFIGSAFCRAAIERGHRLLALGRSGTAASMAQIEIAPGDLANTPWSQVKRFAPDAALHLAWIATPGSYLESAENAVWLDQSKAWFGRLFDLGVPYVAGTGTCIEYAASASALNEDSSELGPKFPYSRAKFALFEWLRAACAAAPSKWSWFRIFYPYGPGEHPSRLTTTLIQQLRAGRGVDLRTPQSVKDYIFVDDVAQAMCEAMEARMPGAINVGTGQGISIRELASRIAQLMGAHPALVRPAAELACDPTPNVIADNQRLQSLGWRPRTSLDAGLQRLISSLSDASR